MQRMSLTLGCWFRLQLQKLKFPHYEGELDLVHLALVKENVFTVHVDSFLIIINCFSLSWSHCKIELPTLTYHVTRLIKIMK